jgi:hypothetical protein
MIAAAAMPLLAADEIARPIVQRNDASATGLMERQVTDPSAPGCGSYADAHGLWNAGTAGGIVEVLTASFLSPGSRYHKDPAVLERIRLAAGFLARAQHADGTIDLLITNFHSTPDTGFVVHNVGTAACLAKRAGVREIVAALEPFLVNAGAALAAGGVHTPNHRWVVCSAMAQIDEAFPDARYGRRIDQWLAEGIDIDGDGQFDERSTTIYNTVCDRAFTVLAVKRNRAELLDPVRRNLEAMQYLLHPDYEVVTEISHRQDQGQRGDLSRYWFPLRYLAALDRNPVYAGLAQHFETKAASLSALLEYPEMVKQPPTAPAPSDYERYFPGMKVARIRRGAVSATMLLEQDSRIFSVRKGEAVVEAVRFASAFFGKGQFMGLESGRDGRAYTATQALTGPYFQPLDPVRTVAAGQWDAVRTQRRQSNVCTLRQSANIAETAKGFQLTVRAEGTSGVPLAMEVCLREGSRVEGCRPVDGRRDCWILADGMATFTAGRDSIRFGPGTGAPHTWTEIRGASPKMAGPSIYLTGFTPFTHTVAFEVY